MSDINQIMSDIVFGIFYILIFRYFQKQKNGRKEQKNKEMQPVRTSLYILCMAGYYFCLKRNLAKP